MQISQYYSLDEYLKEHHRYNNASFGREIGRTRQAVGKMLQSKDRWAVVVTSDKKDLVEIKKTIENIH